MAKSLKKRTRSKKPDYQTRIAKERIKILLDLAEKEFKKHPERTKRYIQLARKLGMRYNVRFTKEQKDKFCKNCNTLKKFGINFQSRTKNGYLILKCLECKKIYRKPLKKDSKKVSA